MQVLALANQKGGCGKTTAAIHLAAALAESGERVLLIDLDPQAHATLGLGQTSFEGRGLVDVLLDGRPLDEIARILPFGFHLAPGSLELGEFEEVAARRLYPERTLERALDGMDALWDWVIIDCPARADGILTANAVRAASTVVLVVETGAFALQGAVRASQLFRDLSGELGRELDLRVLATMFEREKPFAHELLIALQSRFGPQLFDEAIHMADELRMAALMGQPAQTFAPKSMAARQFASLATEVVQVLGPRAARRAALEELESHHGRTHPQIPLPIDPIVSVGPTLPKLDYREAVGDLGYRGPTRGSGGPRSTGPGDSLGSQ